MGACPREVAIVEREWPNGAPVTVPTIRKAFRLELDVWWLASTLLYDDAPWEEYVRAWVAGDEPTALAPLLRDALRQRGET